MLNTFAIFSFETSTEGTSGGSFIALERQEPSESLTPFSVRQ